MGRGPWRSPTRMAPVSRSAYRVRAIACRAVFASRSAEMGRVGARLHAVPSGSISAGAQATVSSALRSAQDDASKSAFVIRSSTMFCLTLCRAAHLFQLLICNMAAKVQKVLQIPGERICKANESLVRHVILSQLVSPYSFSRGRVNNLYKFTVTCRRLMYPADRCTEISLTHGKHSWKVYRATLTFQRTNRPLARRQRRQGRAHVHVVAPQRVCARGVVWQARQPKVRAHALQQLRHAPLLGLRPAAVHHQRFQESLHGRR